MDIIYSHNNNWFFADLAERLFHDLPTERRAQARLLNVREFLDAEPSDHVVVINWHEATMEPSIKGREPILRRRVAAAARRTLVCAECVGTGWFKNQFADDIEWSELVDVGWFEQELPTERAETPYRFVFNAPTRTERTQLEARLAAASADRPIPWAFIASLTEDRAGFADELVKWDPRGFLFLPTVMPVRPGSGRLEKHHLDRILSATRFYIWRAQHDFAYFESFRVLDALLGGAFPVKIDPLFRARFQETGCVFNSLSDMIDAFSRADRNEAFARLVRSLLDRPTLGQSFTEVLDA